MAQEMGKPWVRLTIAAAGVVVLGGIALVTTGSVVPSQPDDALLFQNALLLVVLGSSLLEQHYTRPAEALVNAITALITLIAIYPTAPRAPWLIVVAFLGLLLVSAATCVSMQGRKWSSRLSVIIAALSYRLSSSLGRARIVFSVVFLAAVAFFVERPTATTLSLVVFWAVFMAIWPLNLPQLMNSLSRVHAAARDVVGTVDRVDSPGIVRVALSTDDEWSWRTERPLLVHLYDHTTQWGLPLLSEDRADGRWGTLLLAGNAVGQDWHEGGTVERPPSATPCPEAQDLLRDATGIEHPNLVGFVKEGSTVSVLRVEALPESELELGRLVMVSLPVGAVYYQVTHGVTDEESFRGLHYGSRVASAMQVGRLDENWAFLRHAWLPPMNAPVFLADGTDHAPGMEAGSTDHFTLGSIPGAGILLSGDFRNNLESHTALLGATGSGKTEFAFDLIRHAAEGGIKVVCIDLTSQYSDRLADLNPKPLSMPDDLARELGDKLFDAETGAYGAGQEKRALQEFAQRVRTSVNAALRDFIDAEDRNVGLIELREISNTKATLWITEAYLSSLLRLAQSGVLGGQRVLVVVEEAHTVMPEPSFLGLGDFDSKGTIAKITQIALQGRKYGVGLLVLAQRTATVSKSVLTQCNTVISFACIDDTSINFLRNVYGSVVAESLPSLPRLRAVAHGAWIRSDGPITFEVPYDPVKASHGVWQPPQPPVGPEAASDIEESESDEPPF